MVSYDVVGNVVIVKFSREVKRVAKVRWARAFLRANKRITTIVEKVGRFKGRLRVQETRHLAGERTKETLYKENGCVFRCNVDTCYFSPRLSQERLDVAQMVGKGESVLVMFGGVAPFAIVIARQEKAARVVSVELGRACNLYARENVKRNKVAERVEILQGDVRRVLPKMREKFDRVVMARPNLQDSFLDVAFPRVKKGGVIHYYGFYEGARVAELKELILEEAKKARKKVRILGMKKAGDIGVRKFRWRVDVKVLS